MKHMDSKVILLEETSQNFKVSKGSLQTRLGYISSVRRNGIKSPANYCLVLIERYKNLFSKIPPLLFWGSQNNSKQKGLCLSKLT